MSNYNQYRSHEELTSPSSDEKMDTGSESFRSQDTPNSIRSSDFDDNPESVLRLQNPADKDLEESYKDETEILDSLKTHLQHTEESADKEELSNSQKNASIRKDILKSKALEIKPKLKNPEVLRLSNPEENMANENDSLSDKMSNLNLSETRPNNLKISSPKLSSTLILTTSHPLMGITSPDDYPDIIPKKIHKLEDEKDLSLSSVEDERAENGFYSPQRNTSKNNLYFSENFVTAESHVLSKSLDLPPDVARVKLERRLIIPNFECSPLVSKISTSSEENKVEYGRSHSTPRTNLADESTQDFHSAAEWCDTPAQLRAMPNFDLPIEMSSGIGNHNELESPDVISSSTQEDKSTYQTSVDPYTGSVTLRHTSRPHPPPATVHRRKILVPPEEDCCSVDSITSSLLSDEEEVEGHEEPGPAPRDEDSDDDTQQSKSTNTVSYTSEPIPEYSLCEELSNERAWMSVNSRTCDVKVIEPYKRVVSHGGYSGPGTGAALIVFSACHLPDNGRHDYTYVMDNLFLYVMWSLERLVTDEYVVVYLHGSAGRRRLPAFHWLHECYKLVDRRLRKSLKHLYLVHPTFWLKSFVFITKPFVSSKFIKKLTYINSLDELMEKVPVDPNAIPEVVKQYDANRKR